MSEALTSPSPSSPTPPAPKKSLTEIFNKFAAEAVERFPQLKGQLLVADMNERKSYGHNDIDQKKTGLTPETAREYLRDHPVTADMAKNKGASSCALKDSKQNVSVIFINEPVSGNEAENVSKEAEQHLLFVLDHELAHCGIKDGFGRASSARDYKILLGESVADAYALIRHYQRYGVDSNSQNRYITPSARADNFILWGDSTHFTSFVLDAIAKRKHEVDFDKLDTQQTAELARRFALEFMPPERVVEDLQWTFNALRAEFRKDPNAGIKALIEKALDPAADYYTFKMANLWLKPFLQERTFTDGKAITLPKEYLDASATKLSAKADRFEKEGITFNMPKPPKAQPPKLAA
jgi:hypothetical protein